VKIREITEFKTPKKVYDTPQDYVDARNHRLDNLFSLPPKKKKRKKKKK
jgi:hypothetical protein